MSSLPIKRPYIIGDTVIELCNNTREYLVTIPHLLNPDLTCKICGTHSALHLSKIPICGQNQSQLKRSDAKRGFCLDCFSGGVVCEDVFHPSQSYISSPYTPNST